MHYPVRPDLHDNHLEHDDHDHPDDHLEHHDHPDIHLEPHDHDHPDHPCSPPFLQEERWQGSRSALQEPLQQNSSLAAFGLLLLRISLLILLL